MRPPPALTHALAVRNLSTPATTIDGGGVALVKLDLASAGISSLGTGLARLPHVRFLTVAGNRDLRVLARAELAGAKSLVTVVASGCGLRRLDTYDCLPYLQHLDLSLNDLVCLDSTRVPSRPGVEDERASGTVAAAANQAQHDGESVPLSTDDAVAVGAATAEAEYPAAGGGALRQRLQRRLALALPPPPVKLQMRRTLTTPLLLRPPPPWCCSSTATGSSPSLA